MLVHNTPRAPHSVLFRVRICLFPPFESTPLSPYWQNFYLDQQRAFPALETPLIPKTLLNVPPIFYFITPFLNFSGVQRERERKTTPLLKEISGWKVKYPLFFFFFFFTILGPDLVARKVPHLPEILGTRMRSLRPRSGRGGGGGGNTPQRATNIWPTFRKDNELCNRTQCTPK